MNKLKGVDELNKVVNDFVNKFGCTATLADIFCAKIKEKKIYYSLFYSEEQEESFIKSVERQNPKVDMDIFLWSLLHEIFHIITFKQVTKIELIYSHLIRKFIKKGVINPDRYYYLPIEVKATKGAVEYANTHIEELAKFWKELKATILNFYEINNIH